MDWIKISERLPPEMQDFLVRDAERCWVAQRYFVSRKLVDVWFASHPDYGRVPSNEYGTPYTTRSVPTHWMPLPEAPQEE